MQLQCTKIEFKKLKKTPCDEWITANYSKIDNSPDICKFRQIVNEAYFGTFTQLSEGCPI